MLNGSEVKTIGGRGLLVKLPFGKKKNKFLVKLTSRGKVHFLGTFEANDYQDLLSKINEKLENLGDIAKSYSRIRIMNMSTGEEISIENPFFEGDLDTPQGQSGGSKGGLLDSVMIEQFAYIFKFQNELLKTALKGSVEAIGEGMKELMKLKNIQQNESNPSPARDFAQLIGSLVALANNWDKIKKVVKEARESGLLDKLLGGVKGEGANENS